MLAVFLTASIVATQSGTAQEVQKVPSTSPKSENVSFQTFPQEQDLFLQNYKEIAMEQKKNDFQLKMTANKEDQEKKEEVLKPTPKTPKPEEKAPVEVKKADTPLKSPTPTSTPIEVQKVAEKQKVVEQPKVVEVVAQPKAVVQPKVVTQPKAVAKPKVVAQPKTAVKKQPVATNPKVSSDDNFYKKGISMPYEHQKYLYDLTKKRGLDYFETLAVIGHESTYRANAKGGSNYGYFQINSVNHSSLAKKLGTKVAPFDPYVNINWGTSMLSDLKQKYGSKDALLSAYNKGEGGYKKYGKATAYINKHNQVLAQIKATK